VFVLAELGVSGRGLVEVDAAGRWVPEVVPPWGETRTWPTPRADEARTSGGRTGRDGAGESLSYATRAWATVTTRDHKSGDLPTRIGTEALSAQAGAAAMGAWGRRLNPDWTECLMGLPPGWTLPHGPSLRRALDAHRWPRGRCPADWPREVYWPGYDWEPPRTLPDGVPLRGRPARIRGCGNGVVRQQAALALDALIHGCASGQVDLFARTA